MSACREAGVPWHRGVREWGGVERNAMTLARADMGHYMIICSKRPDNFHNPHGTLRECSL